MRLNKDFLKGMIAGFFLSLFTIYSFFRLYWIEQVGFRFFHWHAILWLYVSVALIFGGISYLLYKRGKLNTQHSQKTYLWIFGSFAGIYVAEIILRLLGWGTTYTEKTQGVFVNPAAYLEKHWYEIGQPHGGYTVTKKEYVFHRDFNAEGFSDKEWTKHKDSNEVRIITLGDSFTEGDGVVHDSCYPSDLEGILQKEFPKARINVMNAGHCGSDPWFEYKKFHDLLQSYKPDIVVYTNGSNDLFFDHVMFGGMERFKSDSTVQNKIPNHWWLGLYEVSYVFRAITHLWYDETFIGWGERIKDRAKAFADSRALSHSFSQLAVKDSFKCVQLIRAEDWEIRDGKFKFDVSQLTKGTDSLPSYSTFNMLPYYIDSLHINKSNVSDYYWRLDHHHNVKGYAAMAQAVAFCLKPVVGKKVSLLK